MKPSRRGFLGASGITAFAAMAPPAPAATSADDDPLGVRKDFPATGDYTFLNTAYIGLISQPVVDAAHDWIEARARRTYSVGHMEAKKRRRASCSPEWLARARTKSAFCPRPPKAKMSS